MDDIIREGDERLNQKAMDVSLPVSAEDLKLLQSMMEYIYHSVDPDYQKYNLRPSVGLAAPQLGIMKRMIAISAFDEKGHQVDLALINPKIKSYSEELTYLEPGEGCLSVDRDVKGYVMRHKRITFTAITLENGELQEKTYRLKGYLAVVFQHEYDHLQGILFPSRINKENPFFIPENATPIKFSDEEETEDVK